MPRRINDYYDSLSGWHYISSLASFITIYSIIYFHRS